VEPGDAESVREAVEKALNSTFDDESWDWWMVECDEELLGCTPEYAVERLVERMRGAWRSRPRGAPRKPTQAERDEKVVIPVAAPPDWWVAHSQSVLDTHLALQSQALSLFGLSKPISAEEADRLIRSEVATQVEEGPPLTFEYLHFYQSEAESRHIISTAWAYPGHTLPSQPLFFLALYVLRLKRSTGCEEHEAVSFLLTGSRFVLPWIRAHTHAGSGVIDLRIGATAIPISEILNAYRGVIAWEQATQPEVRIQGPRRRRPRARTAELLEFIQARHPGKKSPDDWRSLQMMWNAQYPHWRFPTWTAMRERHRRVSKNAAKS